MSSSDADNAVAEAAIAQFKSAGTTHFAEWRYQQATACYTQAIELIEQQKQKQQSSASSAAPHPSLAALLSNRSASYLKQGDAAAALADADACIAANPQWFKAYLRRIAALEEQGKLPEALATCEAAVKALGPQRCDEISQKTAALKTAIASAAAAKKKGGGGGIGVQKANLPPLVHGKGTAYGKVPRGSRAALRVTKRGPSLFGATQTGATLTAGELKVLGPAAKALTRRPALYPSFPHWADDIPAFVKACHDDECFSVTQPCDVPRVAGRVEAFTAEVRRAAEHHLTRRRNVLAGCRLEAAYYDRMDTPMTMAEHTAIVEAACCVVTLSEAFKALLATESGKVAKYTRNQLLTMKDDYTEAPRAVRDEKDRNLEVDFAVRCHWCAATIDLTDPPVCECGEFFCSEECHVADFEDGLKSTASTPQQKQTSNTTTTSNKCAAARLEAHSEGADDFSCIYWGLCNLALMQWPLDELRNCSVEWKKRHSDPKAPALFKRSEYDFLVAVERPMLTDQIERLIEQMRGSLKDTPATQYHFKALFCAASTQYKRMTDVQPEFDSVARMKFKRMMIPIVWETFERFHVTDLVDMYYKVAMIGVENEIAKKEFADVYKFGRRLSQR